MGWISDYRDIVGTQVKFHRRNRDSSRVSRTPPALNHMPIFQKSKSTLNFHRKEQIPWDVLEECLKIESLMEGMHQEYIYMF